MKAPIETKVIAAASGAGLGSAFGTFLLWLLGVLFWGTSAAADKATDAVAAVPEPVGALIVILVALTGSAIAGYRAPHTPRPDLHAATPVTTVVHNFTGGGSVADAAADLAFKMHDPAPAPAPTDATTTPADPVAPPA